MRIPGAQSPFQGKRMQPGRQMASEDGVGDEAGGGEKPPPARIQPGQFAEKGQRGIQPGQFAEKSQRGVARTQARQKRNCHMNMWRRKRSKHQQRQAKRRVIMKWKRLKGVKRDRGELLQGQLHGGGSGHGN